MALLFGNGSRGGGPKHTVEFKAGKMTLKGTTVTPDKRKGLVYIYQAEDGLTHFCWKDRKSGTVEDDLILFPDDCEYKKVTQCKEGSRVFLLKFKSSTRRLFFWMQEPKSDKDEDYVTKVNDALNNPGGSSSRSNGGGSGGVSATSSEQDMQNLLSSMTQAQLMQLIGGMSELGGSGGAGAGLLAQLGALNPPPSSTAASTGVSSTASTGGGSNSGSGSIKVESESSSARTEGKKSSDGESSKSSASASVASASAAGPAIKLDDLQKILSNMQPASPSAVDLSAGVSNELIQRITSNPSTVKKLAPLLPNFGGPQVETPTCDEATASLEETREVADTLTSPQFHSSLRAFCAAFPTGQLGPLVAQFKMGKAAIEAAETGNLEAFVNAIQKEADGGQTGGAKVKDEPEDMNID